MLHWLQCYIIAFCEPNKIAGKRQTRTLTKVNSRSLQNVGLNSRNEPAQFRNSWNVLPDLSWQISGNLNCGNTFQEFLIWAGPFRDFMNCGGTFQEFLIWGWPFQKLFSKPRFFGMFFTSMNQFLASNSHLFRWHVYSAKKIGQKRSFLREIRAQTFYYPIYGVTTACCVPWQSLKNTAGRSATITGSDKMKWWTPGNRFLKVFGKSCLPGFIVLDLTAAAHLRFVKNNLKKWVLVQMKILVQI